jgi:ribonuclease Z
MHIHGSFIEHRRQSQIGTFAHTSPSDLGRFAVECRVKHLIATHIGHVDSLSPVLKRAAAKHLPVELMGPQPRPACGGVNPGAEAVSRA